MSASLLVDLGNTCQLGFSFASAPAWAASGAGIGIGQDLQNADTFCNLLVAGYCNNASGQLRVQVQCSETDVSGNYTDPTSGFTTFPTSFESGGILRFNSGGLGGGTFGAFISGHALYSGFCEAGGFQRPNRYARANFLSGDFFTGPLTAAFVTNFRTTGSGGGFTFSPTSGTVNV